MALLIFTKKYYYKVGISSNVKISEEAIINIEIKKIIEQVLAKEYILQNKDFTKFTKAYYKEDAKEKDYVESSIQDGKDLTLYYTKEEGDVAFLIEYDIYDVVVKHLDCEEFYWSFLRNNFDKDIPSFSLRFHFPNRLNTETFKKLFTWRYYK